MRRVLRDNAEMIKIAARPMGDTFIACAPQPKVVIFSECDTILRLFLRGGKVCFWIAFHIKI